MTRCWTCALCHTAGLPHRRRDICDDCDAGLAARDLKAMAYQARMLWQIAWGSAEGKIVLGMLALIPLYVMALLARAVFGV